MSKPSRKKTIGCKVFPEEISNMKKAAIRLGYKNLSQWLEAALRREYAKALSTLLDQEPQNEPVQPPAATL